MKALRWLWRSARADGQARVSGEGLSAATLDRLGHRRKRPRLRAEREK